jgi:hypothetical protein
LNFSILVVKLNRVFFQGRIMISPTELQVLTRIFSVPSLQKVIDGELTPLFEAQNLLSLFGQCCITVEDVYTSAFEYLNKNYRNEYIYKCLLFKRVILGHHSPKTASMLQEFKLGKSKVDAFVINGIATSYEIKSEYDNFDRLEKQIEDYSLFSDEIYVVGTASKADELTGRLPYKIGIKVLNKRGYFTSIRKASKLNPIYTADKVVNLLTASELKNIAVNYCPKIESSPNTQLVRRCRYELEQLDSVTLKMLALTTLKERGLKKNIYIARLPYELSSRVSQLKLSSKKKHSFMIALKQHI